MKNFKNVFSTIAVIAAVVFASGCSTSGSDASLGQAEGTELNVSVSDLYWGTRDVGQTTTHEVTLTNTSAAALQINAIALGGENADEFGTSLEGGFELAAGESVALEVSFAPQSEGRKYAELTIDYDVL
ncbi:choice-of-anchor D domain-containing protein [Granulosicoccaceae sp. 1_MG-2023]|nr:choice-of-anchor D domain-containing protein [Granulosicoccaceae sp. 1_MG-2023]